MCEQSVINQYWIILFLVGYPTLWSGVRVYSENPSWAEGVHGACLHSTLLLPVNARGTVTQTTLRNPLREVCLSVVGDQSAGTKSTRIKGVREVAVVVGVVVIVPDIGTTDGQTGK